MRYQRAGVVQDVFLQLPKFATVSGSDRVRTNSVIYVDGLLANGSLGRIILPLDRLANDYDGEARRVRRLKQPARSEWDAERLKYPAEAVWMPTSGGRSLAGTGFSMRSKGTVQLLPVSGTITPAPVS